MRVPLWRAAATASPPAETPTSRGTLWRGGITAPLRSFLRTESGSAGVLVTAIVAALVWSNMGSASYEAFWGIPFSVRLGDLEVAHDLRTWVNSGLMTLYFLVVGLETRREIDLGDLRDRRRFVLPISAGLVGAVIPVLAYLAVNLGGPAAAGWGVAMSTDTALALGLLSLIGRTVPGRVRTFLLTLTVVDDLIALAVIATAYSEHVSLLPLGFAAAAFLGLVGALRLGVDSPAIFALLGLAVWAALLSSGVDPVVTGLAVGLTASAYSPARENLERATGLFKLFREQPTAELARGAVTGMTAALSRNARLQRFYHPWTSYVVVPIFGLANAGVKIDGASLAHAYTTPITLGVLVAYVVGKPVAVAGTSYLLTRFSGGRVRPTIGWAAVTGSGTIAGVGFTVALLIANLSFSGAELAQAKIGVLSALVLASVLTWAVFRLTAAMSEERRRRALFGDAEQLLDLAVPVDPARDHVRGPAAASVTIVEYGDFQCPYCVQAESAVREELRVDADLRFVFRHLPLADVHPQAQLAAEAAEAAAAQGGFWPMYDALMASHDGLRASDLVAYAQEQGLDLQQFHDDLVRHRFASRVAQDVESADLSGVSGTPTFFVNGQRHYGAYDEQSLLAAVKAARDRIAMGSQH